MKIFDSFCKVIWLSLVGIMLTACGGGGGGGGGGASAPSTPTNTALQWNSGNWNEKKWN